VAQIISFSGHRFPPTDNSDATVLYLEPSASKGGTYNALQYCKKVGQPYQNMFVAYNP